MSTAGVVPGPLRRQWAGVVVSLAAVVTGGAAVLSVGVSTAVPLIGVGPVALSAGARWTLPTVAVAGYIAWFCYRHLDANRPESDDDDVYRSLGAPNLVTLGRGTLFAAVAGFGVLVPTARIAWVPAVLYGAGCALDAVDGLLARRYDRATELGAKLDMAVDTTGFLVAPVTAVLWGELPVWYLSLSAARYLFKLGRGLRRYRGQPVHELPPSRLRRPLAGLQMAFIAFALSPLFPEVVPPLAVLVLVPSLAVFGRDYLVVAGRLGGSE